MYSKPHPDAPQFDHDAFERLFERDEDVLADDEYEIEDYKENDNNENDFNDRVADGTTVQSTGQTKA